jgi:cell fate (sporulation/competence/biofilm development) regulator YlbF (YheA/YmcA/DUF963 family)
MNILDLSIRELALIIYDMVDLVNENIEADKALQTLIDELWTLLMNDLKRSTKVGVWESLAEAQWGRIARPSISDIAIVAINAVKRNYDEQTAQMERNMDEEYADSQKEYHRENDYEKQVEQWCEAENEKYRQMIAEADDLEADFLDVL